MSRKNRPHFHEPIDGASVNAEDPIEDTIEVGAVVLIDGPIDDTVDVGTVMLADGPFEPVSLGTNTGDPDDLSALNEFSDLDAASASPSFTTGVDFGAAADQASNTIDQAKDALGQVQDTVQDKAQDMAQNVTQTAQDLAGKAQDTAQDVAGKAQDAAQGIADKAQDLTKAVSDKAQDVTQAATDKAKEAAQKIADNASSAKTAVVSAGSTSKSFVAGAATSAGTSLWGIVQRNPLQAILFLSSLIWLIRNNKATASQPAVSVTDAAGDAAQKVGTVAGQIQVAAGNLSAQVQEQSQRGAGWFSSTLQSNPLAIGAMGILFGAGLGFAVPETNYEHKTLGKTRDALADKAQAVAQDLGQKVTSVAQTAVHDAIESGKEEAKNQGLTPQEPAAQEQSQQ